MDKKNIGSVLLFIMALLFVSALTIGALWDTNIVSQEENRKLQEQPVLSLNSWFGATFMKDAESFFSDHAFGRSSLITYARRIERLFEKTDEVQLVQHVEVNNDPEQGIIESQQLGDLDDFLVEVLDTKEERILLNDRVLSIVERKPRVLDYFVNTTNRVFSLFPDYMPKTLIVVPSRIEFEDEEYRQYSDDQEDMIKEIYAGINPSITKVDAYTNIAEHKNEGLYFRTDHHWTALGAYYAAEAFFESRGISYVPIELYTRMEASPFLGFLFAQHNSEELMKHPDDLFYYVYNDEICDEVIYTYDSESDTPDLLVAKEGKLVDPDRAGYYIFAHSSSAYTVIDGKKTDGSSIIMMADSYGTAMAPFIAENYDTVILLDARIFKGGRQGLMELVDQYNVNEVLLLNNILVLNSSYYIVGMENLLS